MLNKKRVFTPIVNFAGSLYEGLRDCVEPVPGSIVYCVSAGGIFDRSGIYVGANRIVYLSRSGLVKKVNSIEFIGTLTTTNIFVSCFGITATGQVRVADRAHGLVGESYVRGRFLNNCHQFTAGCIIASLDNRCNFLWLLKRLAKKHYGVSSWRPWNIDKHFVYRGFNQTE